MINYSITMRSVNSNLLAINQALTTTPEKSVAEKFVFNSKMLYLCTSNRKKASLVPDVGLNRRQNLGLNRRQAPVVNDDQNKGKK